AVLWTALPHGGHRESCHFWWGNCPCALDQLCDLPGLCVHCHCHSIGFRYCRLFGKQKNVSQVFLLFGGTFLYWSLLVFLGKHFFWIDVLFFRPCGILGQFCHQ